MKVKIDNILNYKDPSGLTKKDLLKMKADLIDSARKLLGIMPKNALYDYIVEYENHDLFTYKHKNVIDMIKEDEDNLPENNAIAAMEKRTDIFFILWILLIVIASLSIGALFVSVFIMLIGGTSYFPITSLIAIFLTTIGIFFPKILLFFNDRKYPTHGNPLFEDICVELENIEKTLGLFEELSYLKKRAKKAKKKGKEKLKFSFDEDRDIYFLEVNDDHIGRLWHELKYVNPKIFKKNKEMT